MHRHQLHFRLRAAKLGVVAETEAVAEHIQPAIGIAVAVSCLIAFLVCMILKGQVKSVRKGVDANVYTTAGGGLKLTDSYDHYTHTTETRRKIESNSGGGRSSGGTVSRSGGGGHGRSGKF